MYLCAFLIARRQGNRLKGPCPQASGYELANQDEMSPAAGNDDDEEALVEENLEDEDDFEVSAATMTGHGRENQSLMRLRSSSGGEDELA